MFEIMGSNTEKIVIKNPQTGESYDWVGFTQTSEISGVISLIMGRLMTNRAAADEFFRKMEKFRAVGQNHAGKTFSDLIDKGIKIYFCSNGLEGQVAFTVPQLYRQSIAVTQWGINNRTPQELAGAIVHECAHLNGVIALNNFDPWHQMAWDAPKTLNLPTGDPRGA